MDGWVGLSARIKGDGILPKAGLLAVPDTIDPMSTHSRYLPVLGLNRAIQEVHLMAGKDSDQGVAAAKQLFER